jgi:5-methylcytosine-specific restriction endonuclease McrA
MNQQPAALDTRPRREFAVKTYSLTHLADSTLLHDLETLVVRDRATTAEMLAHIAEVDARRLYAPAAYPSMYAYCVRELHFSEDAASKRIRAGRAARQFPVIFEALADGRLHLSAVVMLAPCLTDATANELLMAATHKSKLEIEQLLAERFPKPDSPTRIQAISPISLLLSTDLSAPGRMNDGVAPGRMEEQLAPGPVETIVDRPKVRALAPQRFGVEFTIGQRVYDKLRSIQAHLGHQVPKRNMEELFERALDALALQIEKRKFAATTRPRTARSATPGSRHIPAHVKRAVRARDGDQCGFVSDSGQRCSARERLEFDHADAAACGGQATVGNIRLLCRAHNQYEAERTFGAGFMSDKRRAAAEARAAEKKRAAEARAVAKAEAEVSAREEAERAKERDVTPYLRRLKISATEARQAAAHCESIPDAPLEERVRVALSFLYRAKFPCVGGAAARGAPA